MFHGIFQADKSQSSLSLMSHDELFDNDKVIWRNWNFLLANMSDKSKIISLTYYLAPTGAQGI